MGEAVKKPVYAPVSKIKGYVEMARACGLDVCGFEVLPNGGFRIMEPRSAQTNPNDFDRWADKL
jgi:hypothetical protein